MKKFTSLEAFLNSEVRECFYVYKLSQSNFDKHLLNNKFYLEFIKKTILRIRSRHDLICEKLMVKQLPEKDWSRMKTELLRKVKTLKANEKINFTIVYEFDDNYELAIEIQTVIK